MNTEHKRLLISIVAALVIHAIVLLFITLNMSDYNDSDIYKPLTVEVSLDRTVIPEKVKVETPQQKPPVPDNKPVSEEIPVIEEPEPVVAPVVKKAEPVVAAAPSSAPVVSPPKAPKAQAPRATSTYETPEIDESFLSAIKQKSSNEGIDARSVFGDDPVPSTVDTPNNNVAAGAVSGSEVVLSDAPPAPTKEKKQNNVEEKTVSVLGSKDLESLDNTLKSASTAKSETTNSGTVTSGSMAKGNGFQISFENSTSTRKLLKSTAPEIPEDIQKAGKPRYEVIVEFDIDADGLVSGISFFKKSSDPRIDAAVNKALRGWVFEGSSGSEEKVHAALTYVIEIK
ncbi:MAG: TonB C-terminal domain-containing protein [Spirochaetales bacterium]|nr:TonB C-terminal domain-containing protein [Spirochaetales bacterium]